jgi:hypothetical protein
MHLDFARPARACLAPVAFLLLGHAPAWGGFGHCDAFIRGDADADGAVAMADGLATLNFLFAGAPAPACLDAADGDDSGDLDLADALYTFFYLHLDGRPPPDPGPLTCGGDPTFDGLPCDSYPPCEPVSRTVDFSRFATFRYDIHSGLGFCPDVGQVLEAVITRLPVGVYGLELSTVEPGVEGDPACLPGVFKHPCLVGVPQAPRLLDDEEVARMEAAFGGAEVFDEPDSICRCIAIDPCLVRAYRWDEQGLSDFPCASPRLAPGGSTAAIRAFIESLKDGP